eukprot:TRINITY_DN17453_c0_g1_i1.p1 TRINITY_DN17453_c0_g1~~TRINITY_DN17453_c0_g1_i1.p1  ORF type:complete len:294 (-),score=-5.49 TRINITY_DN17453_c0_g1_i1:99-941(-)
MAGRVCVVTGANQGIGRAAATAMAKRGATVHLVCRSESRGAEAAREIAKETGNDQVFLQVCDMSSMGAIRSLVERLTALSSPVHVLVNNAGVMEHERKESADGYELNFAVNVLGTFLLTEALLPLLQRAAQDGRVITVSSGGMLSQPLSDDVEMSKGRYEGTEAYARNKRLQVALTEHWARVYGPSGVGFYSMHPGWADTTAVRVSMPGFHSTFKNSLRSPEEGADTIAWLARQPNSALEQGAFYCDRQSVTKHLPLAWTEYKDADVEAIYGRLRAMAKL